jgi:hypothetical protein
MLAFAALAFLLVAGHTFAESADTTANADAEFESAIFGGPEASATGDSANDRTAVTGTVTGFDAAAAAGEKAKTEMLAGGTVVVKAASTIDPSEETATSLANVNGKVFARVSVPDYGTLYVAATVSHALFQGYSGDGTAPTASDQYKPAIALSELHYSFDIAKTVFFRIGNQLIAWGPSRVWSPVDFINLEKDTTLADLDTRQGKSGLRIHVPFGRGNAFAFADFSGMTESGAYGDPVKTVNLGGRVDFTAADFEFGLTGYGGYSATARFGADASGRVLGTTVYGELAVLPVSDFSDASLMASLGFSRPLDELKHWTLSAEGFYNSAGKDLSGYTSAEFFRLPASERVSLYQGMWYAWASLEADELGSSYLTTTLSGLVNLQDGSFTAKLAEAFAFPRAVPFTFSLAYSGGNKNAEFTRYTGDGSFTVTAYTTIVF